ncbi:glycosyl transferase family 90 [Pontiellaceae bacterium B12219]|nr:glycosyl transferase family 90 [Pontiellaceae bacterium B12219]
MDKKLKQIGAYDEQQVYDRVNYYNKLNVPFSLSDKAVSLSELSGSTKSAYYFDYRHLMRYLPKSFRADIEFGDVSSVCPQPTLVKSRPISADNRNNILLKLNSVRHFMPIRDTLRYEDKKDMVVWRGAGWQAHRKAFLSTYWNHPLCDVGQVNKPEKGAESWVKPKMTVQEQLQYKFILSIEGNDVATNLKWIAQSNSLCFMTKPKMETWFMEGRLKGGEHFVELRDDYADLDEKLHFYSDNPDAAKAVIRNFNRYYEQFTDQRQEELIGLLVARKYQELSEQL